MSKGIIHRIGKSTDLRTSGARHLSNVSEELPTVADLVLPGTGHSFSDEFARLLKVLGEVRESA